jgi:hypothetical protein
MESSCCVSSSATLESKGCDGDAVKGVTQSFLKEIMSEIDEAIAKKVEIMAKDEGSESMKQCVLVPARRREGGHEREGGTERERRTEEMGACVWKRGGATSLWRASLWSTVAPPF